MSGLRISAYKQSHPGAKASEISQALGISRKTVYRHRIIISERLPTWSVSDLALKVWLALGESGTTTGLMHDLGCSRATLYRGLAELQGAGLAIRFRSPSTGRTIHRRMEEPMRDPFDVFDEDDEVVAKPKDTVAATADRFAAWVKERYPSAPFQVNRRALMGALGKARKAQGITHYQESTALEMWIAGNPRLLGHAPLWRQFLAAYPALVAKVPAAPEAPREVVRPSLSRQDMERKYFEQTVEMARLIDLELKDRDYEEWLYRLDRKSLYYQRVASGAPLASPWEPPRSAPGDDVGGGGVAVDDGLGSESDEGGRDTGEQDWSRYFEEEDDSSLFHDEDEYHSDEDAYVGPPVPPMI